jgi:hypothetical protein
VRAAPPPRQSGLGLGHHNSPGDVITAMHSSANARGAIVTS